MTDSYGAVGFQKRIAIGLPTIFDRPTTTQFLPLTSIPLRFKAPSHPQECMAEYRITEHNMTDVGSAECVDIFFGIYPCDNLVSDSPFGSGS